MKLKIPFLVVLIVLSLFQSVCAVGALQNNEQTKINLDSGSKIIYVDNNGTDKNDGLTPNKPKRNLEKAIAIANDGDTVQLAPGTYFGGNANIDKDITLSGTNQNNTILTGQSQRGIYIACGKTVTITNITVKHSATGIWNSGTLHLKNSTLQNNNAFAYIGPFGHHWIRGGGIFSDGTLDLCGVTIKENNAKEQGGGIYSSVGDLTVINSTITSNSAGEGAGIYQRGHEFTIVNSTISNNYAKSCAGGIRTSKNGYILNSTLSGNQANEGGGIFNEGALTIIDSIISNNIVKLGVGLYSTEKVP
ncbi:MAG: DUF1565 domain-containing protein [Methanobacterium sp. ERen5]|nr:MAG: DUF1565 domain-containing protein [Methanobacterium sp. ERen5]